MRSKNSLLAAFTVSLFLAGCGGGSYTNPYDGAWSVSYPVENNSSVTATQVVLCSNPSVPLTIKDGMGTTTINASCTTTILATATTPASSYTQGTTYDVSVFINGKGVIDAIVNGAPFTGQCISTAGCGAASTVGKTLSLTR